MRLPPITAEVSLYKSSGHYRSSWPTSGISGVVASQGPAGSYLATCKSCTYNFWAADQLCCQCKDRQGHYHRTCTTGAYIWTSGPCEIFGVGCPDIANCNGQLPIHTPIRAVLRERGRSGLLVNSAKRGRLVALR
jgi:hypothetical protein